MAYLRFVTNWTTTCGEKNCGLFCAASDIRDQFLMHSEDFFDLCRQVDWFTDNLEIPPMLGELSIGRTESWFLAEAKEHVLRAQNLASLLERAGVRTSVLRRDRLDHFIYEDAYQVLVTSAIDK